MSKKVLILANTTFTISNFRVELIESLIKKRLDVYVICPNDDVKNENILKKTGAKVISIKVNRNGLNPFSDLLYFYSLCRFVHRIKPDFIFNYTIKPLLYGSISSLVVKKKIKVMSNITGVGYVFSGTSLKQKILRVFIIPLLRYALKHNDVVFFQNKNDFQLYNDCKLIENGKKIEILNGSGVNLNKFSPRSDAYPTLTFIFVGRFMKDKGVFNFIEAAKFLKKKYNSSISFMMFGKVDSNPESLSQVQIDDLMKDNVFDRICSIDEIHTVLKKNSIVVLPSYREGTPRSVLEGMACGLPIITTDAPGCRETVITNYNGFLIPINNTTELIISCEKFIEDETLKNTFGVNSRILAEEKFDVELVNNRILKYVE
uniref:Glycosyl transferase n=1 Tax=Vibrio parahaemolyticus TaxID=670 RepID=A0A5P4S899_VIBPH|nr:glycosyl transferase [Vibrio parahaemolyticus]